MQKNNISFNVISFPPYFLQSYDMCKLIIKKVKYYKCLSLDIDNLLYNT